MAKGKKTGGRDFKPGEVNNPNGSPGLPADLKHARKLNQVEVERLFNRIVYSSDAERLAIIKDPSAPAIEKLVATILDCAIDKGDQQRLEFILCRLIGKVKDQLEVKIAEPFIVEKRDGSQIVMGIKGVKAEDE